MDPNSLTVTALVVGGTLAMKGFATEAGKDAYLTLKDLLREKMASNPDAETVLRQHENKPEIWDAPLRDILAESGVDKDQEIQDAAREFLEIADPGQLAVGDRNIQVAGDVGNIIQGEGQQVTIHQGGTGAVRPLFEIKGGSVTHTTEIFTPGRGIHQISGEPVQSIEWRWCGPRFDMEWNQASRQHIDQHVLSHEFRMADVLPDPMVDYPDVGKEEIALVIQFKWAGQILSELHKFPLVREHARGGERFNLGREIFPSLG